VDEQHRRAAYQYAAPTIPHTIDRPFARPDRLAHPLYVVTPVYNAQRYRSRWRLFADFKKMVAEAGAVLYTIEVAFGDRDFVVTSPDNPFDIQLRTFHELWLKERMINLAVQRLPLGWEKVAWIDADCHFARYDWADECKHLLEHYPVLQMWSQLHDLNSQHELVGTIKSFGAVWLENGGIIGGDPKAPAYRTDGYPYPYPPHDAKRRRGYPGAPGLAWAMRREAWDQLGGLIDYSILGAGDWYMAHALTGQLHRVVRPDQGRMGDMFLEWQERARRSLWEGRPILGNLGVMPGVVLHYWHGPKLNRRYGTREQILARHDYDPDVDIMPDSQGLYQLTSVKPQLRRDVQEYFRQRNEDALT
jgi:hypothetical protein